MCENIAASESDGPCESKSHLTDNLTHRWLINSNWKVILPYRTNLTTQDDAKGTGETELYKLAKDPFERRKLAESKASHVKRLTKQLNALLPES